MSIHLAIGPAADGATIERLFGGLRGSTVLLTWNVIWAGRPKTRSGDVVITDVAPEGQMLLRVLTRPDVRETDVPVHDILYLGV